jgi:DNA invertase Pin-like site-specific DNA recombinase
MANGRFVAYYRTSTDRQNLGIEAQKADVARFLNGGSWELVAEFEEQESGKRHENRPQLKAAMAMCKRTRATLVIAKMDRLSRNLHFIAGLLESGVEFVACDNPHANKTMIQMLAVFAEHERDAISKRTKDALAAKKQILANLTPEQQEAYQQAGKAIQLGNRTNHVEAAAKGRVVLIAKADSFAANVLPLVERIKSQGATTLRAIAAELNSRGVKSPRGGEWGPKTVANLLARG